MKKIMYDSPEAAKKKTITGWVSSDGHYYGDNEHLARWSGSTHAVCKCGNIFKKGWTVCTDCRNANEVKKYNALQFKEWKGEPLFSNGCHEYFFDEESIIDWCDNHDLSPKDLDFIICDPCYAHEVDEDYWADILPEDCYLSECAPDILVALNALNKIIREKNNVLSWFPGKHRTTLDSARQLGENDE